MWALCPPSYHDNDMPIDLRKKVVLERELDERREYYRESEDIDSPRDYSLKDSSRDRDYSLRDSSKDRDYSPKDSSRDKWQQSNILPGSNVYPFMSEQYALKCSVVTEEREKPQDLRSPSRGTLESTIKKLHSSKLKLTQDGEKEQRCKSTDALLEKENLIKRPSRASSCPDLLSIIDLKPLSNLPVSTPSSNGSISSEIKNYSEYTDYSPERDSVPSPIIGGAKKRKSFVPLYGDRAPVYERYRSPSPQNLMVCNDRGYRSPSPKRRLYIHNGYDSPSPEHRIYNERIYRSPSPKRPIYTERRYYSPSPTRPIYDERSYHSPSPNRPIYAERSFRSPSPKRLPKSPTEHPPYEEYFSHPEVLLRRQLGHQNTSPYFLHVYDYYQHLVQRLREQSSPTVRISSPVSPTPMEDDTHPDAQRKRPCRALTGKHVRQGTGASLSTLLTLRQKIQERQKAKEHQPRTALNGINNKNGPGKKSTPKKVKLVTKSPLGKIQNC